MLHDRCHLTPSVDHKGPFAPQVVTASGLSFVIVTNNELIRLKVEVKLYHHHLSEKAKYSHRHWRVRNSVCLYVHRVCLHSCTPRHFDVNIVCLFPSPPGISCESYCGLTSCKVTLTIHVTLISCSCTAVWLLAVSVVLTCSWGMKPL